MKESILFLWKESESTKCRMLIALFLVSLPKACLCNHHALCVSLHYPYRLLNVWTNLYETMYVYHGTRAHLSSVIDKSLPSVCVYMCIPLSLLDKGPVKTLPSNEYTCNNRRSLGHVVLCAVRVVSMKVCH
jgi:hypothetical protein